MVANIKEVMRIEGVKKPIPTKLCKSCMAGYQKLKILQMLMLKVTKFLERLHVNIEEPLSVTFLGFRYFFSIKNNA